MKNTFRPMGVVQQVKLALHPKARLAALIGFLLGGIVPLASYVLAHSEVAVLGSDRYRAWILVAGGLLYSAKTVYEWAALAFTSALKAVGFCVLIEGVMITGHAHWLAIVALCYLVGINGTATACALSIAPKGRV